MATDFAMTPGTCGKDGQSVPVGCGQATMRLTGVTIGGHGVSDDDAVWTLAATRSWPRAAARGEEVEVYVARGTETEVRAYDGRGRVADVGRLLGRRHPGHPRRPAVTARRPGFAWAGSLDPT